MIDIDIKIYDRHFGPHFRPIKLRGHFVSAERREKMVKMRMKWSTQGVTFLLKFHQLMGSPNNPDLPTVCPRDDLGPRRAAGGVRLLECPNHCYPPLSIVKSVWIFEALYKKNLFSSFFLIIYLHPKKIHRPAQARIATQLSLHTPKRRTAGGLPNHRHPPFFYRRVDLTCDSAYDTYKTICGILRIFSPRVLNHRVFLSKKPFCWDYISNLNFVQKNSLTRGSSNYHSVGSYPNRNPRDRTMPVQVPLFYSFVFFERILFAPQGANDDSWWWQAEMFHCCNLT